MKTPEIKQSQSYMLPPTDVDYHNWTYRGTPKQKRDQLNIGNIYVNAAICNSCGYFIRSRNRHDFVSCKCGSVAVDGGSAYIRRVGRPENYINVIELYDDVKEAQ